MKLPVVPVKWYRLAKLASQVKKYLPVNKYHQVNLLVHVVNLLAKVQNIHHYQVSPAQVKRQVQFQKHHWRLLHVNTMDVLKPKLITPLQLNVLQNNRNIGLRYYMS